MAALGAWAGAVAAVLQGSKNSTTSLLAGAAAAHPQSGFPATTRPLSSPVAEAGPGAMVVAVPADTTVEMAVDSGSAPGAQVEEVGVAADPWGAREPGPAAEA